MARDDYSRTVYTTESGRVCSTCGRPAADCRCKKKATSAQAGLPGQPNDGTIRIHLDRKGRGGKSVSVITGLTGSEDQLRQLAAELKRQCGTGGTLKDGIIEIQGDHRDLLVQILQAKGLKVKRAGG